MGKEEGLWAEELSRNERCACGWTLLLCSVKKKKTHNGSGRLGGGENETPIFISSQTVLIELTCLFFVCLFFRELWQSKSLTPYPFFFPPDFSETPRMLFPSSPLSAHSPALADHSKRDAVTSDECVEGLWLGSWASCSSILPLSKFLTTRSPSHLPPKSTAYYNLAAFMKLF